jgi:hypothetical protein
MFVYYTSEFCGPIVATGRRRQWRHKEGFLGTRHGKVYFWHKLDPLLGGTLRGRQPRQFGTFLTHSRPCACRRCRAAPRVRNRFDNGRTWRSYSRTLRARNGSRGVHFARALAQGARKRPVNRRPEAASGSRARPSRSAPQAGGANAPHQSGLQIGRRLATPTSTRRSAG